MNLIAVVVLFGLIGILFYELFVRLKVLGDIQQVFNVAPTAVKVIRSTTLSDEEKEKSVRHMSLVVLKDTFTFTAKLTCILLACVALAAITQFLFTLSPDGLSTLLASWQGLIAAVVVVAVYTRLKPGRGRADSRPGTAQYHLLDRLLHRIAFIHPGLQKSLADVENDLFKKQLAGVEVTRPVFVTGLPRAGTTLLLELLYDTGQFASFTYRQMPFVLNPLLWNRLTAGSRKQGEMQERAHGDGMLVSYDSPEAFEEVLWVSYQGKTVFDDSGMRPLTPADLNDPFRQAFVNLARKLVCLEGLDTGASHRPATRPTRELPRATSRRTTPTCPALLPFARCSLMLTCYSAIDIHPHRWHLCTHNICGSSRCTGMTRLPAIICVGSATTTSARTFVQSSSATRTPMIQRHARSGCSTGSTRTASYSSMHLNIRSS